VNDAPVLTVHDVSKRFGGVQALNRVSLELSPGEVLGLVGDNGAGKTTLIKVISGVYQPDEGEVRYKGARVQLRDPNAARSLGIETIYQDLALADNLDVGANVFLGREPQKRLFGLLPAIDRKRMRDAARDVLDTLDIGIEGNKLTEPVGTLSGGQRQAVAISRAIYWHAEVLIMDEPMAALGVPEQRKVMALIQRLKEQGVAIILISHNMTDVFNVCGRAETDSDEIIRLMLGG
jgi:simple sugar transport system ATP-binding protein